MIFTQEQMDRYARQIILRDFGSQGQERLLAGRVLIVGVGGLGSAASLYLAAAGVGTLGLVDGDDVEISNLQRQIIHATSDIGHPKVMSAAKKIKKLNPDVVVKTYAQQVVATNIMQLMADYDFVIDGTDNAAAKFLINDACVLLNKPYVHGGVLAFKGQIMTIKPRVSACYRCIFPEPPPESALPQCSEDGVMGVLPGLIGVLQATEALKFLLCRGELLTGRLLIYDGWETRLREVLIRRNPLCPVCGEEPSITGLK